MTHPYAALAERVQGLEDALVDWVASVLSHAELTVGVERGPTETGVRVHPQRVLPERPPDVGIDYALMGMWGSDEPAAGPVPAEWAAVGLAVRKRFEAMALEQSGSEDLPPPAHPLDPAQLPQALARWYETQPAVHGSASWTEEPWLTDSGRARLPFLSWYPGFEVGLDYRVDAIGELPVSRAAILAVIATAMRLERVLSTPLPSASVPPPVVSLLAALNEDGDIVPAPAPDLQVSFNVESHAEPGGEPWLGVSLRLPVLRGVRLRPSVAATLRTAPPKRPEAKARWRSRNG